MSGIFSLLAVCGVAWAMGAGRLGDAQRAMLSGGAQAVSLTIELAGTYALFGGALAILRESGAAGWLSRRLQKPLSAMLGLESREADAAEDVAVNVMGNLLGLGGAATPAGLAAMKKLARAENGTEMASDAMIAFVVLNASGVQLFPTTMIALRASVGVRDPSDIWLPTLLVTMVSAVVGLALCCVCRRCGAGRG